MADADGRGGVHPEGVEVPAAAPEAAVLSAGERLRREVGRAAAPLAVGGFVG